MARIPSKKYTGVYLNHLINGDISYSITYKDAHNRLKRFTVGKKSQGITEKYSNVKRNEFVNTVRLDEDPTAHKKKKIKTTLDELASVYFTDKVGVNKGNLKQLQKYNVYFGSLVPSKISSAYETSTQGKNIEGITLLGSKDISLITKDDVMKFRQQLVNIKKASKTINGVIVLLTAIINYSIKEKDLKLINPTIGIKKLKEDDNRERFLSISEVSTLLEHIKDDELIYLFVKMALTTGARLEGLLHIQKKDINLDNQSLTLSDLKSETTYTGFYDDEIEGYLKKAIGKLKANDYVMGGSKEPLSSRVIQRKLKPLLDKLFNQGLDLKDRKNRVVIHTLRHTFASQLAIQGTPIFTIQKLMNHADIKMTMRYAKLAPDSGKNAVKGLYDE